MQHASSATIVNNSATAMNVTGSVALTPNSRVFINRVSANAEIIPIATPAAASFPPCATTSFNHLASDIYSVLRATIGSTFIALRAGT